MAFTFINPVSYSTTTPIFSPPYSSVGYGVSAAASPVVATSSLGYSVVGASPVLATSPFGYGVSAPVVATSSLGYGVVGASPVVATSPFGYSVVGASPVLASPYPTVSYSVAAPFFARVPTSNVTTTETSTVKINQAGARLEQARQNAVKDGRNGWFTLVAIVFLLWLLYLFVSEKED